MAVFTVTTLDDTVAADGELSLREAVTLANAASDFDTINFAAGLRGTVNLTAGRLILTQGVSITGDTNFDPATPDITIDGSGNDPYDGYTAGVFSVTNNAYARFGSLVITGGQAKSNGGGGIHTDAGTNVTVVYSVIAGNSASTSVGGGIWARGNLSIDPIGDIWFGRAVSLLGRDNVAERDAARAGVDEQGKAVSLRRRRVEHDSDATAQIPDRDVECQATKPRRDCCRHLHGAERSAPELSGITQRQMALIVEPILDLLRQPDE